MTRRRVRIGCLTVLCLGLISNPASAEEPPGADVYRVYCASCHGVSGAGDGPVAPALKNAPTDLTALARRSGGKFDEDRVIAIIDGKQTIAAHGPREMPVWGAVFDHELKKPHFGRKVGLLRARVLAGYLQSIQKP